MNPAGPMAGARRVGGVPGALLLVSLLKFAAIALDTVVVAPIAVAVGTADPDRAYQLCQLWSLAALLACNVRVRARRTAPLDPRQPYVFMANHRSHFDVLAVVEALHEFQLRWVAKRELTRVPIFGWALQRLDHVIIDRSDHAAAVASIRAAREKMMRGVSVTIFPEGTRAPSDAALLPFKKGGFMLAVETGLPIVPIAVRGSRRILARGEWQVRAGEIEVIVGPPFPTVGVDRDRLVADVRAWIEQHACDPPPAVRAETPVTISFHPPAAPPLATGEPR